MLSVEPGDEIERAQVRLYHAPTERSDSLALPWHSQRDGALSGIWECSDQLSAQQACFGIPSAGSSSGR
jgi:hypothetical protein